MFRLVKEKERNNFICFTGSKLEETNANCMNMECTGEINRELKKQPLIHSVYERLYYTVCSLIESVHSFVIVLDDDHATQGQHHYQVFDHSYIDIGLKIKTDLDYDEPRI